MSPSPPSLLPLLLSIAACTASCTGQSPDEEGRPSSGGKADDVVLSPTGLDLRPSNTTCVAPDRPQSSAAITHRRAFENLSFTQPVQMKQPPQSERWYVVEKRGVIWSFSNSESTTQRSLVLDHRSRVNSNPNEAGLLGLAFHPDFAQNGIAFLSYNVNSGGAMWSVISRIESGDGGQTLDQSTETLVLALQQPFGNHNGGNIEFGPDGFLYIGFGDGGDADDPHGNGQNTNTLLGTMLRIDIDNTGGDGYGIPASNPFVNGGGRAEIYAYGLRNPWRFSFDQANGQLWTADVGQDEIEEVDIIVNGGNYGWNRKEGDLCFAAPFPCSTGVIDPVGTYNHDQGDRSITGGHVYRGTAIPNLAGTYFYADFFSEWIRSFRLVGGVATDQRDWTSLLGPVNSPVAFATDGMGEMYVISIAGSVHKIVPTS
jgi:glucose/arabinose dehydrogenase